MKSKHLWAWELFFIYYKMKWKKFSRAVECFLLFDDVSNNLISNYLISFIQVGKNQNLLLWKLNENLLGFSKKWSKVLQKKVISGWAEILKVEKNLSWTGERAWRRLRIYRRNEHDRDEGFKKGRCLKYFPRLRILLPKTLSRKGKKPRSLDFYSLRLIHFLKC